jgi:hypothetical protein
MEEIFMLRPKEIVCKWVDAFNNHDVEAIMSLYHDNATNHQVTNDPVIGIDAIREMFTAEFATADMTAIVENIFEDGQWAILEWKDPLGLRGCGFFHVVNGKILFQYNDPQFLEGRQPNTMRGKELSWQIKRKWSLLH